METLHSSVFIGNPDCLYTSVYICKFFSFFEQFTPKEKKELNVDNKKVEVTDFEKILSQEAPYEYFSKQKNWQNILDSLEGEELFQMKELMKYAYIYETSAENRQSLDAYLFILEDWKKRDLPNDSEKQAKLDKKC